MSEGIKPGIHQHAGRSLGGSVITIGLIIFLLFLAGFIFNREVPEHRAAGRKGLMVFHTIIGLGCIAGALVIFWNRFGENFVEGTKWFQ